MKPVLRGQSYQMTVNHAGKRHRRQFATEIEAMRWGLDTKERLQKGLPVELGETAKAAGGGDYRPANYGELTEYLIAHRWKGTKAAKSAIIKAKHMAREIGEATQLKAITNHTIKVLAAKLRDEGYPDSTLNTKLSTIRVCMQYAHKERWIDFVPDVPFYKVRNQRLRRLSGAEERGLIRYFEGTLDDEMRDLVIVGVDMGFRLGEILSMQAMDVNERVASVYDTKSNRPRSVPPTDRAREVLMRRKRFAPPSGHLWSYTKDQVTYRWNKARDHLGFIDDPDFVPHAMRHTYCSRLADLDTSAQVIQALAGHLRIETTLRYIHLGAGTLAAAVAKLASHVDCFYTASEAVPRGEPRATVACHKVLGGQELSQTGMV